MRVEEMKNEIVIIIEFNFDAERREEFMARLIENCRDTLEDDGCYRMEIAEPIGTKGETIYLTERWRDQEAIDMHRAKEGHDAKHEAVDRLIRSKKVVKGHAIEYGVP